MASFQCPYCSNIIAIDAETTYAERFAAFTDRHHDSTGYTITDPVDSCVSIDFYRCPNCGQYTIKAKGIGNDVKDVNVPIRPISSAKQYPQYIPEAIRQDYEEACAIVSLSPKASATLSRRCIQGMIRDFWDIKESNLSKAIEQLEGKIPVPQWNVINGVRRIGNIGAHMEKDINLIIDIDPDEAQKLIKLIEHLLEQWYINRHEQELLYADIIGIDETKQSMRKKTE